MHVLSLITTPGAPFFRQQVAGRRQRDSTDTTVRVTGKRRVTDDTERRPVVSNVPGGGE